MPRYLNGSSFTQEWVERRTQLMAAWRAPVLIVQGAHSDAQPVELYEDAWQYIPNVPSVEVRLIDAGHFWPVENPEDTTAVIETFLTQTPPFDAAAWLKDLEPEGTKPHVAAGTTSASTLPRATTPVEAAHQGAST